MSIIVLYKIVVITLGIAALVWMIVQLKWLGAYIAAVIVIAALLTRWSEHVHQNALVVVSIFMVLALALSRLLFRNKR
jgi:hypothetical protein